MGRAKGPRVPVEQRVRIVLSVLAGEVTMAEAARRHGVTSQAVMAWRDRFLEAGKAGLADRVPGPPGQGTHTSNDSYAPRPSSSNSPWPTSPQSRPTSTHPKIY